MSNIFRCIFEFIFRDFMVKEKWFNLFRKELFRATMKKEEPESITWTLLENKVNLKSIMNYRNGLIIN